MRHLVLAAALAAVQIPQTSSSPAGVWAAAFNGTTFVRLELHDEGATLAGRIATSPIQVDEKGDLRHVAELSSEARAIFDVKRHGTVVTFSAKDSDDDTNNFEFRMLDSARAELKWIPSKAFRAELAANDIPVPKPFVLTRQAP
jgi:hypothetical protein